MEDFNNKKLIKLMWLPEEEEILFYLRNEESIKKDSSLYQEIANYLDMEMWKRMYKEFYRSWLNDDDPAIYNIHDDINKIAINALVKMNSNLQDSILYYWFDIDRTHNDKHRWEFCPLSSEKLIYLGDDFNKKNCLISPKYPLVFPS